MGSASSIKEIGVANLERRRFVSQAALAATAASWGLSGAASAQPSPLASFGALKNIDVGVLNVAYAEAGPANGRQVILLHGWP